MQVREIMTMDVETIYPDDTLQEAARRMMTRDVGLLLVTKDNRLIGVLTDRDMTVRAIAAGRDPTKMPVREVMTEAVICCFEYQDVREAANQMIDNQIRRLPVLNRENKLIGIASLADLVHFDEELGSGVLKRVSEPRVLMGKSSAAEGSR